MTIRYTTVEGTYKIVEVTEVEIEPITSTNMETDGKKMFIQEAK